MEEASHFIRHLARINRFRIYTPPQLEDRVFELIDSLWNLDSTSHG